MAYDDLKRACMAFQLKDGNFIMISKDDVREIAAKIVVEGSMIGTTVILREKDRSIEKANLLFDILKKEPDMKPELRNRYLKQIGDLLSCTEKVHTDMSGQEVEFRKSLAALEE